MKKICLLFLFTLVSIISLFAEEYTISSYDYIDLDSDSRTMQIKYDDGRGVYAFQASDYFSSKTMIFTEEDLNSMRVMVQKALEWQNIAIENKASVTKEIPNSKIYMVVGDYIGSTQYVGAKKVPVTFNFYSKFYPEDDIVFTALMIVGGSTTATSNEFIDIEFQSQIIADTDIQHFADAISEETFKNAIEKHNNDAKIADDLFI